MRGAAQRRQEADLVLNGVGGGGAFRAWVDTAGMLAITLHHLGIQHAALAEHDECVQAYTAAARIGTKWLGPTHALARTFEQLRNRAEIRQLD